MDAEKRKWQSKSSSTASKRHEIKTDSGPRVVDKETQSNTPDRSGNAPFYIVGGKNRSVSNPVDTQWTALVSGGKKLQIFVFTAHSSKTAQIASII